VSRAVCLLACSRQGSKRPQAVVQVGRHLQYCERLKPDLMRGRSVVLVNYGSMERRSTESRTQSRNVSEIVLVAYGLGIP